MYIGFCGPEGAGKSTAANQAADLLSCPITPFAAPLKRMLEALGVPHANLYGTPYDKEQPLSLLCGKSARQAMQSLGTEWGRQQIADGFWLNAWRVLAQQAGHAVADDVRYPNEAEAVRQLGGKVICVVRSMEDFKRAPKHPSENFQIIRYDHIIVNDGSLAKLREDVRKAILDRPAPKVRTIRATPHRRVV